METVDEGTIHLSIIEPCGKLHVPDMSVCAKHKSAQSFGL